MLVKAGFEVEGRVTGTEEKRKWKLLIVDVIFRTHFNQFCQVHIRTKTLFIALQFKCSRNAYLNQSLVSNYTP